MTRVHFKDGPTIAGETRTTQPHNTPQDLLDKIYNLRRLDNVVKAFGPYKAAGPDGLQPILIQKSWNHINNITINIMKTSHRLQYVPMPWRESKGIFLAKPGKTDYYKAKAYRTITLTSVFLKIQEKSILWHMNFDLNMGEQLSDRQYGFKKGSSTETALHKIIHCIEKRIAKKGYILGTFLDIEGAFDNVSFEAISNTINKSPVDSSTAGWIINMVTNRHITINHKNVTNHTQVKRGCPQGGILSPFLWNLVVDDLLRSTTSDIPGYIQAYADDLVTLVEGQDLDVIRSRTQKIINTIERWCTTKGLNISTLKTKIVMFTWKRKWVLPKPIKVGGTTIELANSVKFLGITLDSKLNFNEHIHNITKKATTNLMQCKRAVGPTWELTPLVCHWIYLSVIRPILTYSCVVWVNALHTQKNTKPLEGVQRLALSIMSGAIPGTPSISLNKITDTAHIVTFLKGEAAKGASRLQAYKDWTAENSPLLKGTIKPHTTLNNTYLQSLQLPKAEGDLTKTCLTLNMSYETEINDRSNIAMIIGQVHTEAITCYTDGSKTDQGVGYGYIITTNNNTTEIQTQSAKLPDFCTIYQAELTALTAAAEALKCFANRNIYILTDSQAAIHTLNKSTMNSQTALNCHGALNNLAAHNVVKVLWVAGHEGHWGNKRADQLAKDGTVGDNLSQGFIPQSYIKNSINHKVRLQDADNWTKKGTRHSKLTLNNNQSHLTHLKKLLTNRGSYRTALQLITGHAGLNYHLHKMGKVSSGICPNCDYSEETVGHFLGQCPAFNNIRGQVFNIYYTSMTDIFESHNILKIVSYANRTKRFHFDPTKDVQQGVT